MTKRMTLDQLGAEVHTRLDDLGVGIEDDDVSDHPIIQDLRAKLAREAQAFRRYMLWRAVAVGLLGALITTLVFAWLRGGGMTDRHAGFLVVLGSDIREDDAQATIAAIGQIRGVLSVVPVAADRLESQIAEQRVRHDLSQKLWKALSE